MAGVIGALDNNIGVVGVAPGPVIIPVKVLDADGSGSMSDVIKGIEWVAANGKRGDVCNISLSGNTNEALDKAVRRASRSGVRFVLSAGNTSSSAATRSPSRANNRRISTITAVDQSGELAWFANTGKPPVDYAAPGVEIKSTYKDGGYATMDGTRCVRFYKNDRVLFDCHLQPITFLFSLTFINASSCFTLILS